METKTYQRYQWLLQTLQTYKRLTFEELDELWKGSDLNDGSPLSKRTFLVHKAALESNFKLNVMCDKSDGYRYYIEDVRSIDRNKSLLHKWLMNSFAVSTMLSNGQDLSDRIILDEVPFGSSLLGKVAEAMRNGRVLKLEYRSYYSSRPSIYHMRPYCLRMHNQRWYVLGWIREKDGLRHIALDRTGKLEITGERFRLPRSFDAEAYYRNCIGIYRDEHIRPVKVRLRTFGIRTSYMRSLPLHESQEEVVTEREYSDFCYRLCITPELVTELLRQGSQVKVLEPRELQEMMAEQIRSMVRLYEGDNEKDDRITENIHHKQ